MKKILITMAAAAFASAGFAQTTLFDAITPAAGVIYSFNSAADNTAGEAVSLSSAGDTLTGFTLDFVQGGTAGGTTTYADLQMLVTIYSTPSLATSGTTAAFSGALESVTYNFGAQTLTNGDYYSYTSSATSPTFSLPTPVTLSGSTFGVQIAWLSAPGVAATTLETGMNLSAAPTGGSNALVLSTGANGFYFSSGGTSSSTSLLGSNEGSFGATYPNENMALTFYGTSPAPEPASMAVLGLGIVGLIARRRRSSK